MSDKPVLAHVFEKQLDRREFMQFLGCVACATAFSGFIEAEAQTTTTITPFQVLGADEVLKSGEYKLFKAGKLPLIVYASDTEEPDSLALNDIWLVAYSRRCSHRGTTIREPNSSGVMHCPDHKQDFDTKTGIPVGPVHRTNKPLTQFKLELNPDNTVWLTDTVRVS